MGGVIRGDHVDGAVRQALQALRERGIKTWCNSLSLSKNLVYGAGYDDLKSLRFGGDAGWGRLIRQGVDIIQTDWPYELWRYLKEGDSL